MIIYHQCGGNQVEMLGFGLFQPSVFYLPVGTVMLSIMLVSSIFREYVPYNSCCDSSIGSMVYNPSDLDS